jgi:NADPH2:quinone reductase
MPLIKGFSVVGVRAGEYGRKFPERGHANLEAIWNLAATGQTRPRVHAALPLDRWREAFALMQNRELIGRVVIRPDAH